MIQAQNGKAFEWAVANAIKNTTKFSIVESSAAKVAEESFNLTASLKQASFILAAQAAIDHILSKEAIRLNAKEGYIEFNKDFYGAKGDVRDILIRSGKALIGISCKTNHDAFKHSRLSNSIDFVKKWGLNSKGCSEIYWNKVGILFSELKRIKCESSGCALWKDIVDVPKKYYWPILDAFADEIVILYNDTIDQAALCKNLFTYIVGTHDFYKIMASANQVQVQAFNFHNTLVTIKSKLPTTIIGVDSKNGGQYSKTIRFNRGYTINFRIHNASSRVEPSLKFDIKAIGLPPKEIYTHHIQI